MKQEPLTLPSPRENAGRGNSNRRPLLVGAAGWLAVAAILALLCRNTRLDALRDAATRADPWLLGAAVAASLVAEIVVSSAKLRRILALLGTPAGMWETTVLRMGTYPVRQLIPFKSGELLRISYLNRRFGLSIARAGILAIIDAGSDAGALAVLVAVGLALREGALGLLVAALAIIPIAALAVWRPRLERWRHRLGDAQRPWVWEQAPAVAAWTAVLVILELGAYGLVLRAFHLQVPLSAMVLFVPMVVFAAGLPATPMGLGIREAAITFLLAPYGAPAELLAAGLASSAVVKMAPAVAGIAFVRPLLRRLLVPAAA